MFKVTRVCYEAMLEDSKKRLPNEACGLLSGEEVASTFYSMTNTDQSPVTYLMDPKEQFQAFKAIRAKGEKMLGIYHSHIASQAYPSSKDIALAFYPEVHYLLVSLENRNAPKVRAFRIQDGTVREEPIEMIEETS